MSAVMDDSAIELALAWPGEGFGEAALKILESDLLWATLGRPTDWTG